MSSSPKKRGSIRTVIVIIFVIAFTLLATILQTSVIFTMNSNLGDYAETDVQGKYTTFKSYLDERGMALYNSALLLSESYKQLGNPNNMTYMRSFLAYSNATEIYLCDNFGRISMTTQGGNYTKSMFQGNAIFKQTDATGATFGLSVVNGHLCILAVSKVFMPGKLSGYFILLDDLTASNTVHYFKTLLNSEFGVIVDNTFAASTFSRSGKEVDDPKALATVYEYGLTYFKEENVDGIACNCLYEPVELTDDRQLAAFYIGVPKQALDDTKFAVIANLVIAIAISAILFIIIMMVVFNRLIIRPLKKAAGAVHDLAVDTDADLTFRTGIRSNNELGALCEDLDVFLERQQNMIIDLKSAQVSLTDIGNKLGFTSEETASAITQIAANINGVKKQAANQSELSNQSAEKIQTVASKVNGLDQLIQNQSAGIVESSAAIEEMIGNISSVSNSVSKMSGQFKELIEVTTVGQQKQAEVDAKVTQMAQQSRALMEANSVISRIASQTNLLAMNAAIEAAHAGEAGAGFSVVADEIRSLAENSSKQSHNISQELKGISKTITEVVEQSSESRSAFVTITDKLSDTDSLMQEIGFAMNEQNGASQQVLEALKDINASTANVQGTAKEVRTITDEVQSQVSTMNNMAQMVMSSVEEMGNGTTQISQSASQVSELANQTLDDIQGMDSLIGRFKV